jgi:hypothetical protein
MFCYDYFQDSFLSTNTILILATKTPPVNNSYHLKGCDSKNNVSQDLIKLNKEDLIVSIQEVAVNYYHPKILEKTLSKLKNSLTNLIRHNCINQPILAEGSKVKFFFDSLVEGLKVSGHIKNI